MPELLVVDDHPLFRDGFAYMVRSMRPQWTVHFADHAAQALAEVERRTPDLIVIDVVLPGEDGFSLAHRLHMEWPHLPAVLVSGRDDPAVRIRARACGALGFVSKAAAPDELLSAIEATLRGDASFGGQAPADSPALTPRQAEVLMLLTEGHGNKEIRHRLGIAERTVRAHMTDIFELLGAHSRTQAVIRARELGLIR